MRLMRNATLVLLVLGALSLAMAAPKPSPWTLKGTAAVTKVSGQPYAYVVQMTSTQDPTQPYGVTGGSVNYVPAGSLYFQDLLTLGLDWKAVTNYGGGSPRIYIKIDFDGDGVFNPYPAGPDGYAFAYVIPAAGAFNGGPTGWLNTGNLVGSTWGIWDTTQFGGPSSYSDYTGALALLSGKKIMSLGLVIDGGWMQSNWSQIVWANNMTINSNVYTATGAKK